ncbi:MAG: hypothetical protein ABI406_02565, partial [Ktedonobacteraceae bacterium]
RFWRLSMLHGKTLPFWLSLAFFVYYCIPFAASVRRFPWKMVPERAFHRPGSSPAHPAVRE